MQGRVDFQEDGMRRRLTPIDLWVVALIDDLLNNFGIQYLGQVLVDKRQALRCS